MQGYGFLLTFSSLYLHSSNTYRNFMVNRIEMVQEKVEHSVSEGVLKKMISYVKDNKLALWRERQPPSFLQHMVVITIYHDLTGIGYSTLEKEVKFPYKISHKSLSHNCQKIRKLLGEWGNSTIKLNNESTWKLASIGITISKRVKEIGTGAYLWIDSVDLPINKFKGYITKFPWYSFKLNGPGRRFMLIRNGRRKVVGMWGGYTPKLYDGHWVQDHKKELNEKLAGATIFGDNHFQYGAKYLKNAKILTPNGPERKNPDMFEWVQGDEGMSKRKRDVYEFDRGESVERETKEELKWNADIKRLRARVEEIFGYLTNKFVLLAEPFRVC